MSHPDFETDQAPVAKTWHCSDCHDTGGRPAQEGSAQYPPQVDPAGNFSPDGRDLDEYQAAKAAEENHGATAPLRLLYQACAYCRLGIIRAHQKSELRKRLADQREPTSGRSRRLAMKNAGNRREMLAAIRKAFLDADMPIPPKVFLALWTSNRRKEYVAVPAGVEEPDGKTKAAGGK